jgi:RNA polymerase sigma factor (sigma-70 family)
MAVPKSTIFATTRWTMVREAAQGGSESAREALGGLFLTYWRPLYRFVRRQGKSPQDAEDLVQGFFTHLLSHNGLRLADHHRGRFRAFLLGSLKNFAAQAWQRQHRLKRGGQAVHLSLDWEAAEAGLVLAPADQQSPDRLFDRDWALALLETVLDHLARSEPDFARWKRWLSVRGDSLPYAQIAAEMHMTEGATRVALHRLRKRYREGLRRELGRTLATDALVDDEMQALFSALTA